MSRMIPSFPDDTTPPGERDVFNLLAQGPDDWVVLHALDLAPWNHCRRTEIDFVVIMPDTGILCIEVKSHEVIEFRDDRWYPDTIRKSPFRQALDGSQAFYRRLRDFLPRLARVPVVHACIFPRARFDILPNMAVDTHELIDGNRFRAYRDAQEFCRDLEARARRSIEQNPQIPALQARMAPGWIEDVISHSLPVRRRRPDLREEIEQRERETEALLREQQKPVLMLAELNPRVVVDGPAGTGKTLIAMEVARRAAESGRRTALLCYNRLVGDWLSGTMSRLEPALPNLVVGTVDSVLMKLAGIRVPENPEPAFWDETLPDLLEERMTDPDFAPDARFDVIVLDEAQDILARTRRWQALNQFLEGGVRDGKYVIFGDFEHQVLHDGADPRAARDELIGLGRAVRWRLDENCRNYRIVGETAVRLSGFGKDVYSGYRKSGGGNGNFDFTWYENGEDQADRILEAVETFRKAGYHDSEIVILGFMREDRSVIPLLRQRGMRLHRYGTNGDGIACSTVHAFKGLEAKVVLLIDFVPGEKDWQRHLLYTGMTRATEAVRIFCDTSGKETLIQWLNEGNS